METSALETSPQNANGAYNSKLNSEIIKFDEIKDSPFTIVQTKEGYFGAMANHRLTEFYDTKQEAKTNTLKITWNRIIQVMAIIAEKTK